ncbi:GFA family protein [Rhodoferax saidenbachensis]|uniref:Aldehyde-activating protein n=1 Tax=Rhodoferax saidenbachensis TaxID=1484693 RepID=A0A1P8KB84_9BURK|nr:GFA family protein [Rhodoferax saidenbachensis]APW43262.1 aldehyde-activating protein [Rhodoferax saidenbachensis]
MAIKHHGSCLCKGVQFTIEGALAPVQVCHCAQCRRAQGGPFATNIPVDASRLSFSSGQALLHRFESSPGKVRVFCAVCGSPVFSARDSLPGIVRIRAGLLAEPVQTRLAFHAHVNSKASWWPIDDALPQHPEGYVPPTQPAR